MIRQARFAKSIRFFKEGFLNRWGLTDYSNNQESCIFVGIYRSEDVDVVNNHKGFKLIWNTGRIRDCFKNIDPINVVVMENTIDCELIKGLYKIKRANIEIKDFSLFKLSELGNKVYCYLGNAKGKFVMGFDLMKEVEKEIKYEIIQGFQGNTIEFVRDNIYNECFVNLKPNLTGGITSAVELALMGRRTISNTIAPFCMGYKSVEDIVRIINEESKKIGIIQASKLGNYFDTGEEWREEKFWL